MSERTSLLEEQRSEQLDEMNMWKSLLDHRGWQEFTKNRREQMAIRQEVVCSTPITTLSAIAAQEFIKGQFAGMKEDLEFVQAKYEEAKRRVTLINQLLENESETEERILHAAKSRVDTTEHFGE